MTSNRLSGNQCLYATTIDIYSHLMFEACLEEARPFHAQSFENVYAT